MDLSSYTNIAEKAMTMLRLKRDSKSRTQAQTGPLVAAERFSKPFITIAREPGSGGKIVGQEVAKRLGFTFYDHELIEEIAKSTKLRKSVLDQVDEKGRTALQDLIQGLVNPDYVSDITYFTALCKVILSIAYKGNAVILGRGANFITPFAQGLHVYVTAPKPVLIQRAIDFEGHAPQKAKEIVSKVSSDRQSFVKQYFGKSMDDLDHYDLVVNTTFFKPHEAAEIILRAYEMKLAE